MLLKSWQGLQNILLLNFIPDILLAIGRLRAELDVFPLLSALAIRPGCHLVFADNRHALKRRLSSLLEKRWI